MTTQIERVLQVQNIEEAGKLCSKFIDTITTSTGRASHYNTRKEAQEATETVHAAMFLLDRGVYAAFLQLPGVMDNAKQMGIQNLLAVQHKGGIFDLPDETLIVRRMTLDLPRQRQLKSFMGFKANRMNNARTKKLILRTLLNADNIEWMVVKYRAKVRNSLIHALGERRAGILKSVLSKDVSVRDAKENFIVMDMLMKYVDESLSMPKVEECVAFALGAERTWTLDILASYHNARRNQDELRRLPPEVAAGIAATYHPTLKMADIMRLTKDTATEKQKIRSVRKAREVGVEVEVDYMKMNPIDILVLGFEDGFTEEMNSAVYIKAMNDSENLPYSFESVSIILDCSSSMAGSGQQKWRPIAIGYYYSLMLQHRGKAGNVCYAGASGLRNELPICGGDTRLAVGLIGAIQEEADAIFVITDGYENAPAGRFAEVLDAAKRGFNFSTPVIQMTPVLSAENFGTRQLSVDIPVVPVNQNPASQRIGLLKSALETDFYSGIQGILDITKLNILVKESA